MTLAIECAKRHQEEEIQKLQLFLMVNYQGRLDGDKTPVENVIEILRRERMRMRHNTEVSVKINELQKENAILSRELLKVANQLEEWSSSLYICDQSIMKEMAIDIRHKVKGIKFFKKENENG